MLLCGSVSFASTVKVVGVSSITETSSGFATGAQFTIETATIPAVEVQPFSVAVTE